MLGKLLVLSLLSLWGSGSIPSQAERADAVRSLRSGIPLDKTHFCPVLHPDWLVALKRFEDGRPEDFARLERLSLYSDNESVRELARTLLGFKSERKKNKTIAARRLLPRSNGPSSCLEELKNKTVSGRLILIRVTLSRCGQVIDSKILRGTSDTQLNECFRKEIANAVFMPYFDGHSFAPDIFVISILLH